MLRASISTLVLFTFFALESRAQQFSEGMKVQLNGPYDDSIGTNQVRSCAAPSNGTQGTITKIQGGVAVIRWNMGNCIPKPFETIARVPLTSLKQAKELPKPEEVKTEACAGLCGFDQNADIGKLIYEAVDRSCSKRKPKKDADVEKWLDCYGTPYQNEYRTKYKKMIEIAAARFKVDAPLLKCLLQRESTWNKDLESPTCAYGLAQAMPDTAYDLGKEIGDSAARIENNISVPHDSIPGMWDEYSQQIQYEFPNESDECTGNFFFKNIEQKYDEDLVAYERAEKAHADFKKGKIKKQPPPMPKKPVEPPDRITSGAQLKTIYNQVTGKTKTIRYYKKRDCKNSPKILEDNRACASSSIGAAAILLRKIKARMEKAAKETKQEGFDNCEEAMDRMILAALGYNRGPGAVGKAIRANAKTDEAGKIIPQQAKMDSFSTNAVHNNNTAGEASEANDHLRSIRNCLDDGPNKWAPPAGDQARQCDKPGYPLVPKTREATVW